ncbi:MAG: choice-of-anchor X domain-containing protein [Thermoanaerobaculia bacterium]
MKRATVVALVVVCMGFMVLAQQPGRQSSPVAERAAVMLLEKPVAAGNAVLYVQYPAAQKVSRVLKLDGEKQSTTLRDDGVAPDRKAGDGTHSAYLHVDRKRLAEHHAKLLDRGSAPLFAGRELIGAVTGKRSAAPVALKDIPAFPNAGTFRRVPRQKQSVSLALPLGAFRTGALTPVLMGLGFETIDADRSLLITDPSVVDDETRTYNPCAESGKQGKELGPWTFGHLMEELAKGSGSVKEKFVREWVAKWESDQTVNGLTVTRRPGVAADLLADWPLLANGELDLGKAPFKLVAIVNRIDLGENLAYGSGDGGEARFIFAVDCNPGFQPPPFLVIFEYEAPASGCAKVKTWAQQWKDLDTHTIGPETYNAALEAITRQFTEATSTGAGTWSNHLNQIRTNEAIAATPWEFREFAIQLGRLNQVTVKQTPDDAINFTEPLATYAEANAADILAEDYVVPDTSGGTPFLGGSSQAFAITTDTNSIGGTFWDADPLVKMPPRDPLTPVPSTSFTTLDLRYHLSLNTCNGCHAGETETDFAHVKADGTKSGFLTGIEVADPAGASFTITLDTTTTVVPVTRHFDDLLLRRARMASILYRPCEYDIVFQELDEMAH